ncbi:MAG TPA: slipin family protein [Acidimicrobiales bacterium]|nr:slipin family protein [Acidimicrobiales bacterium]
MTHASAVMFGSSGAEAGIIAGVVALLVVGFGVLSSAVRVVTEYERSVFFRLGRVRPEAKGPGVIFRIPVVDRLVKVTLRVEVVDIPPQAVITKDNVTIQVDAVVYFQVVDPIQAVVGVDNFRFASQRIAMTSLRSIIGRHELDNLLAHREDVNNELRTVIAASTAHWGVEVRQVELRDITLPPELLRAMARQAEAERERRAKVIAATGELEASQELSEAAAKLYESPGALQLRALQTLAEVASEHNSTLVFPVPIELLTGYLGRAGALSAPVSSPPPAKAVSTPPTPEVGSGGQPADSA